MENKHLKGLDQALTKDTIRTKKSGGPSDALKRVRKRPENSNWRLKAFYNEDYSAKCEKCGATATVSSTINGEVEYQLCSKCYSKRNVQSKKI